MLKTGDVILYSRSTTSWMSSFTGMLSRNNSNKPKTEYSHCGMILRDPTFIHSSLKGLYVWQSRWQHDDSDSESGSSSESESDHGEENESDHGEENESDHGEENESDHGEENDALANLKDTDNGVDNNAGESIDDGYDDKEYDGIEIEILPLKQVIDECDCPNITARTVVCDVECFSDERLRAIHKTVTENPENIFPQEDIKKVLGQCDLSSYDWSATFLGFLYSKCGLLSKETKWHLLRSQDFAANTENLRFNKSVSLDNDEFDLN